jgi:hypothetical protein
LFKSKSRSALRRRRGRPAVARLALEALETRAVPTVIPAVNSAGVLVVRTDNPGGGDNVTIDHQITADGPTTLVNQTAFPDLQFASIQVQGGFGHVLILGTFKPLTADSNDFVNVGSAVVDQAGNLVPGSGNMQNIRGPLFLTNDRSVNLDDSNDPTGQNVTMNVVDEVVQVNNMARAPININVFGADIFGSNDLIVLRLFGGRGHNTFNVLDTPLSFRFGATHTSTDIFTGPSNDTVNVLGTHSAPLNIVGKGSNVVNIGNNGSLQGIQSHVAVRNNNGFTSLHVDGSAATSSQTVTMSVGDDGFGLTVGKIDGLTAQEIDYDVARVSFVEVKGGNLGNTFTVEDTFHNGQTSDTTQINTGAGFNQVFVHGVHGQLNLNGRAGIVNIGSDLFPRGSLQGIQGGISITNPFGGSSLTVNDAADPFGRTWVLSALPTFGLIEMAGTPAKISYVPNQISHINLNGGQGNDLFKVLSSAGPAPIQINGLGGNDLFIVGNLSNTLDDIHTPLQLNGNSGFNVLVVNDQGSSVGHFYAATATAVTRAGNGNTVTVNYSGIQSLQVHKSPHPFAFNPDPFFPNVTGLALTGTIRAGKQATLTGRLIDEDANTTLSLQVDWGDGSDPEQSTPDRVPFRLRHRYAEAGDYVVRVFWSDSSGQSNFQELPLTVTAPAVHADFTPNQRFVAAAFQDLLNRDVDPAGLAAFAAVLDHGGSRAQVAQAIIASPEYHTLVVRQLYTDLLHREADAAGLAAFVNFLNAGGTAEQVQAQIAASPEYTQLHGGSSDGFLAALYGDLLGRGADQAGRAAFGQALAAGADHATVAAALLSSAEYQTRLVNDLFERFLDRDADAAGRDGFGQALAHGVPDDAVVAALLASAEYAGRL